MSNPHAIAKAIAMYDGVPDYVKDDLVEAVLWARQMLTDREGAGHTLHITAARDGRVVCSFAKPEWSGDHCSQPMDDGSQAVVMAVCEYLSGA